MRAVTLILSFAACNAFTTPTALKPFSRGWVKEAEKKHSRVALVAVPSLMTIAAMTGEDPVQFLNNQPAATQLIFYSTAGLLETLNLKRFDKGFNLKEGEEPGKLLPIQASETIQSVEDWAGRLAMVMAAGYFATTLSGGM
tara:strand:+ start:368 stop:790 length:423 start_codon:yes stop_codon:yes gene_type:complete